MLRFELLGNIGVSLDEEPLTDFVSGKARALLIYLALNPRQISRDALAGLLWGETPEADAKASLRMALSNLRKLVKPYLDITRTGVTFNRERPVWIDVEQFRQAVDAGNVTDLATAVSLYQGEFLAGFNLREAPGFEAWAVAMREHLQQQALAALQTLVDHYSRAGRETWEQAIHYAQSLLALDPWQEAVHRRLMLLLARNGRYTAALSQYETCRRALAEGLGIEPMPETTVLYERIRSVRRRLRDHLPATSGIFVGRRAELTVINDRLAAPGVRLLTLVGMGGVGKTRLARAAAAAQVGHFLEGVHFVPLAAVAGTDRLAQAILETLDHPFASQRHAETNLLNYLRQKEMLLVLDNFEHLLHGVPLLARILAQAPGVKCLVTSRQRLNLRQEWVLQVEGLPVEQNQVTAAPLPLSDALDLFQQRVRQVNVDFTLTEENLAAAEHICRLLGGLPLGIELAAAWGHLLSLPEIAGELSAGLDLLAGEQADLPGRHRNMEAVFYQSWIHLSPPEQEAFRRLSYLRGRFDREAAVAVSGATLPRLAGLVNKSFLRYEGSGRYDIHTLLRQFGQAQLAASSDALHQTAAAHAAYFARFVQACEAKMFSDEQVTAVSDLNANWENIRAGWDWALAQQEWALIDTYLNGVYRYYRRYGRVTKGEQILDRAIRAVAAAADPNLASLLGRLLVRRGACLRPIRTDESLALLQRGLDIAQKQSDTREVVYAKQQLFSAHFHDGNYDTAEDYAQECLRFLAAENDRKGQAFILNDLGTLALKQGDFEKAADLLRKSLSLFRPLGLLSGMASNLNNLSLVMRSLGNLDEARRLGEESLHLKRRLHHLGGTASTLFNLGLIALDAHDLAAARAHFEEALGLGREMGDSWDIVMNLYSLGLVSARQHGEIGAEAAACFREALGEARRAQTDVLLLELLTAWAQSLMAAGEKKRPYHYFSIIHGHPATPGDTRAEVARYIEELAAAVEEAAPVSTTLAEAITEMEMDVSATAVTPQ